MKAWVTAERSCVSLLTCRTCIALRDGPTLRPVFVCCPAKLQLQADVTLTFFDFGIMSGTKTKLAGGALDKSDLFHLIRRMCPLPQNQLSDSSSCLLGEHTLYLFTELLYKRLTSFCWCSTLFGGYCSLHLLHREVRYLNWNMFKSVLLFTLLS